MGSPDPDTVLGGLVRIAAAGDPDAALVVLHLLAPAVRRIAHSIADLHPAPTDLVAGELMLQIQQFPVARRNRHYAANLTLDTRKAVLRELLHRAGRRETPVEPADLRRWLERSQVVDPAERTAAFELEQLLAWAVDHRVVTVADVRLLLLLERDGHEPRAQYRVAARCGMSERTLRRRRNHTLAALRAATGRYLADTDDQHNIANTPGSQVRPVEAA
jgi:hypothetical protein